MSSKLLRCSLGSAPLRCAFAGAGALLFMLAWSEHARASEDDLSLDLGASSLELRRIAKGTFQQGSPPNEPGREADEAVRSVTLSRSFWLGKVPVTRAQFSRFVTETRFVTDAEKGQSGGFGWDGKALVQKKEFTWRNPGFPQKDEDPVVLVTFGDATAFTAWAGRKSGRRVRLPTEAEWEYAARAGTTTPWPGASKDDEALAFGWFKANSPNGTHPVGTKRSNAFGLFDMSGNVYQWCRDVYAPYPAGDATDPENTTTPAGEPERRVLRGGSWLREPKRGRSAARYRNAPGSRNADNGFRVAIDEDGAPPVPTAAVPTNDFAPAAPVGLDSKPIAASASAAPTAGPARSSTEGIAWSLLAAPAAAAGAVVAWMAARRRRGSHTNAQGITTRSGHDGFWVRAPNVPAGSRVRYVCVVNGVDVSDVVPLDGASETFVYTGAAPSAIRITEVVVAPAQSHRGAQSWSGPAAVRDEHRGAAMAMVTANERRSSPSFSSVPSLQLPPDSLLSSPTESSTTSSSSSEVAASGSSDDSSFGGYPSAY